MEIPIGSTSDKVNGMANQAAGNVKQGVGSLVGSDKLKAEGAAQEAKGDAQKATGDAKAAIKTGVDNVAKSIKKAL